MRRLPAVLALALATSLGSSGTALAVPDDSEIEDPGLPLLRQSATAARERPYTGTLFTTSGAVLAVRNTPGAGMTVDARSTDPGSPAGGLLAPSDGMLRALGANYRVVEARAGSVCGRPARLVEAVRHDGRPAARYWIDAASGVPLRREVLDGHGRVAQAEAFVEVTIPTPVPQARPIAAERPAPGPSAAAASLRARGWSFPNVLPGGFELADAAESAGYLKLGYSDGVSVVSVFVQRGTLDDEGLAGWRSQLRDGNTIWIRDAAGLERIWASGGHVYTVVADAPPDVAQVAIGGLPHEAGPGFWQRFARGADRVLSWVNPFA
ncbi:sigma-E factor regulatory protein RseB domain-containing protein [Nonomuraea sp. NPDC059194]|uniref:sigma-E factor regulatory protein RseB domain-containing protein n=1 Tax=Nonomuraea sp. NPDC059194 TaxID=3346764 RepID=UPI003683E057